MYDMERQTATTAVRAIGLHAAPAADATLESIAAKHPDSSVRRQAATSLGAYRGASGVAALSKMLAAIQHRQRVKPMSGAVWSPRLVSHAKQPVSTR